MFKMFERPAGSLVLLALLALLAAQLPAWARAAEPKAQQPPPFPQLADWRQTAIKIVSESVDEQLGTQVLEESHDLEQLKSAYYTTSAAAVAATAAPATSPASDYHIKYVTHAEGLVYAYRPYACEVTRIADLPEEPLAERQGGWNFNYKLERRSREFRYFGVYALWSFANTRARTFARAQIVYSASKDVYRESLMWQARDEPNKLTIKLFFIDHNEAGAPPALEMIQVEVDDEKDEVKKKRLVRTINVLSIQHSLADEVYSELFEPPVGFGCLTQLIREGDAELIEARRSASNKWANWAQKSLRAELEVTATKYNLVTSGFDASVVREERKSETFSVEVAQSQLQGLVDRDYIELIRWRNTREDRKVVVNHLLRLVHSLDMRLGSCQLSHFAAAGKTSSSDDGSEVTSELVEVPAAAAAAAGASRTEELYEHVLLKFKNLGLELDVSVRLFQDPDDLHFVKRSPATARQPELRYYEGGPTEALKRLERPTVAGGPTRHVRMISVYTKTDARLDLHSLTIWVLNEPLTRVLESYQINLIEARQLEPGWPDEPKLFDVSDECYLQNAAMIQNRDFAWFELAYPAPSRLLNVLVANELQLKRLFYEKAVMDFSRAPRLEVLFEEDSFLIRALLLDVPATELIYDKTPGQLLVPALQLGDLSHLAPDLAHCGRLCRLEQCTVMSYCTNTRACLLSARQLAGAKNDSAAAETAFRFASNQACDTYKMPASVERNQVLKRDRLHGIIARLQHQNYGIARAPKLPDELALPRGESGLSERDYMRAVAEYQASLNKFLEQDDRAPELAISTLLGGHYFVLMPSRFELESDPLREFDLFERAPEAGGAADDSDDSDDDGDANGNFGDSLDQVPRFHQGLSGWRYQIGAAAAAAPQTRDGGEAPKLRQFTGLTYDQCALACADSKCGSFSFCSGTSSDCVLANVNSTGRAQTLGLLQPDAECFVAQRDFLRNFLKFERIFRPQTYASSAPAGDASECALACVAQTAFKCLSFEFCAAAPTATAGGGGGAAGQCYYQTSRHLPPAPAGASNKQQQPLGALTGACDHYSRAQLADFVRLEFRRVEEAVLKELKTNTFSGLSVFACAEKCADGQLDCSAFQFCHRPRAGASRLMRECTTIESAITPALLGAVAALSGAPNATSAESAEQQQQQQPLETIVDEQAGGLVLQAAKYLAFDEECQLFTLARDSSEAQLRELAFDGLVKTKREKELERVRQGANGSSSAAGLTFWSGLGLYLLVALVSAALGCGLILLKEHNAYVRQRVERLRIVAGL